MKLPTTLVTVVALPLLVLAHGRGPFQHRHVVVRDPSSSSAPPSITGAASTSSSSASASGSTASPASNPASSGASVSVTSSVSGTTSVNGTAAVNGTTSLFPTPTGPIPSVPSLASTNPTAVPLQSIVVNIPSAPTLAMPTAAAPGSTPSGIPNAPGLPNVATLSPGNYPALDRPPPTDSAEVQQWIQEVQNSGVNIPSFNPTSPGGCGNNTAAQADSSRCWWTCGGCTRSTDIVSCPTKNTWGLTYDDGPAPYTPNLLQYLDQVNLKSTFFVVGSRAISFPALLQQEYLSGHHIAVHTWSHPYLTTLTNEEIIAELGWSKKIIKDVLGVTPTMMRPPFGDIDDRVRAICQAMNLMPVIWTRISPQATFDTDDYNIHGGITSVQQVLVNWEDILGNVSVIDTGFIVLEHDLFQQSVEVATGYILPDALAHQPAFTIEPVISCLNLPMGDAYLETNNNASNPLPLTATVAPALSSGAPGSAQATAGSSSKKNAASVGAQFNEFFVAAAAAALGGTALFL